MKLRYFLVVYVSGLLSCTTEQHLDEAYLPDQMLLVLGVAQDAGYPQSDCKKACCDAVWNGMETKKMVSCLGIVDRTTNEIWMLDATPDFKEQLFHLQSMLETQKEQLDGILLTHAHMGHYTGLMDLGREAMGAKEVPVYAMPRMRDYLENNGPWSQLVDLENITLHPMMADSSIRLNENISITPIEVPHRDEFSETVGFHIKGKDKSALFIPDIDKWQVWDRDINAYIREVDYAFLDGTFYKNGELPNRDMSEIPHPFIEESMVQFSTLDAKDKAKVRFIHLNHTNPLLQSRSDELLELQSKGFFVAHELGFYEL